MEANSSNTSQTLLLYANELLSVPYSFPGAQPGSAGQVHCLTYHHFLCIPQVIILSLVWGVEGVDVRETNMKYLILSELKSLLELTASFSGQQVKNSRTRTVIDIHFFSIR